jgi:hypothetical protein
MLIEYRIKVGEDGLTATHRVEPDTLTLVEADRPESNARPAVQKENHLAVADPKLSGGDPGPKPFGGDPGPKPFGGDPGPKPFGGDPGPKPFGGDPGPKPFGGDPGPKPFGGGATSASTPIIVFGPTIIGCPSGAGPVARSSYSDFGFYLEKQYEDKWCWAAVTVGIDHYFSPTSSLTQCRIARQVITGIECCADPVGCNQAEDLEDGLKAIGRWKETRSGFLSFQEIQNELDAYRPVCARIGWYDKSGHFVILSGYRLLTSGVQLVEVADPFFANSIVTYNHFVTAYQSGNPRQPGGGEWTHTFLLKK